MPVDKTVIAEIKECPICHHPETMSQKAAKPLKESGQLPKEVFTSLSHIKIPMTDPRVAITVPTLLVFYDACGKCGFPYATKAETYMAPVVVQQQQQRPPGSFSPS